jgi:toxin-antitoxin system PIN domain toxin
VTTVLLDANVLIALTDSDHEHHARASAWAESAPSFALCPITEGAFIRYHLRRGQSIQATQALLKEVETMPRCEFWPDAVSYATADLSHVIGHRQVTDAYLAALVAARPRTTLITFDQALASAFPDLAELVPETTSPAG